VAGGGASIPYRRVALPPRIAARMAGVSRIANCSCIDSGMVNVRTSINDCGGPYQTESVPHRIRSGPTARSSFPIT
jgi:hypothetical protein